MIVSVGKDLKKLDPAYSTGWGGMQNGAATLEDSLAVLQKCYTDRSTWLAVSEECVTLALGVMSSRPTLGVAITKNKESKK